MSPADEHLLNLLDLRIASLSRTVHSERAGKREWLHAWSQIHEATSLFNYLQRVVSGDAKIRLRSDADV